MTPVEKILFKEQMLKAENKGDKQTVTIIDRMIDLEDFKSEIKEIIFDWEAGKFPCNVAINKIANLI